MSPEQQFLSDSFLWVEGGAALIALYYFRRLKRQHWRYFIYYLLLIFACEVIGKWGGEWISFSKTKYYNYIVIPFQFIFFYWLYAVKSFSNKKLFWLIAALYVLSFMLSRLFFKESKVYFSFNYTLGCLLLMFLVIKEYYNQVNSLDILNFQANRMFYINLGVTLFYIGTLPFFTFYSLLRAYIQIWDIYFDYFLISGIVMYILFSISFIWGKQSS
ncbi:hypothetical protein OC25_12775 [Pedobacter kyungheensis]|uniref:Histidine kinase N-terminal 7TM region domain-containing protein n=1 Tax=Pedobacter kyungheensis TaxID=1069985 RepID=A0A0C1FZN1_9SPHI|nr:hypothetical protein [Pedobacter kyungheensis]KIA93309.1 hypothetical protein OC25_12775 [Pedobacter kyungheensis]